MYKKNLVQITSVHTNYDFKLWGATTFRIMTLCIKDLMEQRTFKNVNNNLNTNLYPYLETTGGQSSNLQANVVHFFNTSLVRVILKDTHHYDPREKH